MSSTVATDEIQLSFHSWFIKAFAAQWEGGAGDCISGLDVVCGY